MLGVLSLFGIYPAILLSAAVIVFGSLLLIGDAALRRLGALLGLDSAGGTGAGGDILAGVAGIVLGILGLAGLSPLVLVLAALLSLGLATLLKDVAGGGRLAGEGPMQISP